MNLSHSKPTHGATLFAITIWLAAVALLFSGCAIDTSVTASAGTPYGSVTVTYRTPARDSKQVDESKQIAENNAAPLPVAEVVKEAPAWQKWLGLAK